MPSEQNNNPNNKKVWAVKILGGIAIICTILFLMCFPDILFFLRIKIYPDSTNNGGITAKEYVEMMLIIIEICSTGILSFIAYRLSKGLGRITINEQKAKIILWATRIENEVKSNSTIILNKHLGLGANLDDLYTNESSLSDIINLSTEHKITVEEQMLLISHKNSVAHIRKKYQKNEDVTEELKLYVQKFLETTDAQLIFEQKMDVVMEKLKKYSKGEM